MNGQHIRPAVFPALGCLGVIVALALICMLPLVLVDLIRTALTRLHLPPTVALLTVFGIFAGSLINIPVHRIERIGEQPYSPLSVFGYWGDRPPLYRVRSATIIAVNVGGCVIPTLLAVVQIIYLARGGDGGSGSFAVMGLVAVVNIAVCYRIARPVQGVGIMMPGFVSPLVSVGLTWLLLSPASPDRVSVAFVSGVLGPLIGADLLHLKDITRVSTGMMSIGGAGTFDGIVLSGILAALLA